MCFLIVRPERNQTIRSEIRLQELLWLTGDAGDRFGSQIATAHSAFHRCGPTSRSPIPCEKELLHAGLMLWTPPIDARLRGKCCSRLFDDGGLHKVRFTRGREGLADLFEAEIDDFLARFLGEVVGGADDELEVLVGGGGF